jgi:type VI secretion system protein ImpI
MKLTLEVMGSLAGGLGLASKDFDTSGGTIGRLPSNTWGLPDSHVSKHHALISYEDGVFYIEDTESSNGIKVNSKKLAVGQRYPLRDGDTVFIDPFEMRAMIAADSPAPRRSRYAPEPSILEPDSSDPLSLSDDDRPSGESVMENIFGPSKPAPVSHAPRLDDLRRKPPLSEPFVQARERPAKASSAPEKDEIPTDWYKPAGRSPKPRESDGAPPRHATPRPIPPPPVEPRAVPPSGNADRPADRPNSRPRVADERGHAAAAGRARDVEGFDFAEMLRGAGLGDAAVTPELARAFGQILRVVVGGIIGVLEQQGEIKEKFGIPVTTFKPREATNNPLKFSTGLEDALQNLFVKNSTGYLGPVEAFEDAFADLQNNQFAMLEGMRAAYEAMLDEFRPDHLEGKFDRQKAGALVAAPGKLRYWDQYRENFGDMVRDVEACFSALFGQEFARVYEEQLDRLRAQKRGKRPRRDPRT